MAERQLPSDSRIDGDCDTCDTLQLDGCDDPECPYGDSGGAYYPYANATGFPDDSVETEVDRIPAREDSTETGMSVPESISLADYVSELEERRRLARLYRDQAKHSPVDYRESAEWAAVVDEYSAEIEYWQERLDDGREQAVESRRAALTDGDSV